MFVKRVGKFMQGLVASLNGESFVTLSAITHPHVAGESDEDKRRTIRVMEMQKNIEVSEDADGNVSLRLTPSGVALKSALNQEVL